MLECVQMVSILRDAVAVSEGSFRLSVLSGHLAFHYLICFSQQEEVWELDVPLVVRPLRWFICLLGSFILFLCFPLFGVIWLFVVGRVSNNLCVHLTDCLCWANFSVL
jgi:hypothetical protein